MGLTKKQCVFAGISLVVVLMMLRACSRPDVVALNESDALLASPVVQSSVPVVVHGSDSGGFFSGMLLGHMMRGNHTTVVHHYSTPHYSAPRYYRPRPATTSRTTRSYYGRRR